MDNLVKDLFNSLLTMLKAIFSNKKKIKGKPMKNNCKLHEQKIILFKMIKDLSFKCKIKLKIQDQ